MSRTVRFGRRGTRVRNLQEEEKNLHAAIEKNQRELAFSTKEHDILKKVVNLSATKQEQLAQELVEFKTKSDELKRMIRFYQHQINHKRRVRAHCNPQEIELDHVVDEDGKKSRAIVTQRVYSMVFLENDKPPVMIHTMHIADVGPSYHTVPFLVDAIKRYYASNVKMIQLAESLDTWYTAERVYFNEFVRKSNGDCTLIVCQGFPVTDDFEWTGIPKSYQVELEFFSNLYIDWTAAELKSVSKVSADELTSILAEAVKVDTERDDKLKQLTDALDTVEKQYHKDVHEFEKVTSKIRQLDYENSSAVTCLYRIAPKTITVPKGTVVDKNGVKTEDTKITQHAYTVVCIEEGKVTTILHTMAGIGKETVDPHYDSVETLRKAFDRYHADNKEANAILQNRNDTVYAQVICMYGVLIRYYNNYKNVVAMCQGFPRFGYNTDDGRKKCVWPSYITNDLQIDDFNQCDDPVWKTNKGHAEWLQSLKD